MKKNMGTTDKVVRLLAAIMVGVLYITGQVSGLAAIILGIFAVTFLVTSAVGVCPLYWPLKLSTIKKKGA
jgi:Na+(H+)/acetate symporter ActP